MTCSFLCYQGLGYCFCGIIYCFVLQSQTASGKLQAFSMMRWIPQWHGFFWHSTYVFSQGRALHDPNRTSPLNENGRKFTSNTLKLSSMIYVKRQSVCLKRIYAPFCSVNPLGWSHAVPSPLSWLAASHFNSTSNTRGFFQPAEKKQAYCYMCKLANLGMIIVEEVETGNMVVQMRP